MHKLKVFALIFGGFLILNYILTGPVFAAKRRAVTVPAPYYYADNDQDGYGNPNVIRQDPNALGAWVINNSDCNDNNRYVYRRILVTQESDYDGYGSTPYRLQCVGDSYALGFGNFVHYKDVNNQYTWADNAKNTSDCNDGNINLFQRIDNLVKDPDYDGYYSGVPATYCVGSPVKINGRQYYERYGILIAYDLLPLSQALGSINTQSGSEEINLFGNTTQRRLFGQ